VNGNHLIPKPMRRVHEVAGIGQQDKLLNLLACANRPVTLHHVTEGLHPCTGKSRWRCVEGMRVPLEVGPIQDPIVTYLLGDRG
jgi:hypothetical protein